MVEEDNLVDASAGNHHLESIIVYGPGGVLTARSASEANSWQSIAWSPSLTLFAAVAADGRGDAVGEAGIEPLVPQELAVIMGVDVDPARGDDSHSTGHVSPLCLQGPSLMKNAPGVSQSSGMFLEMVMVACSALMR